MITYRQWLAEQGDFTPEREEAFEHFVKNEHKTLDDTFDEEVLDRFENTYLGYWDRFKDFVEERFADMYDIPDFLDGYIDYEAVARDWRHSYWESDGHVFANC